MALCPAGADVLPVRSAVAETVPAASTAGANNFASETGRSLIAARTSSRGDSTPSSDTLPPFSARLKCRTARSGLVCTEAGPRSAAFSPCQEPVNAASAADLWSRFKVALAASRAGAFISFATVACSRTASALVGPFALIFPLIAPTAGDTTSRSAFSRSLKPCPS